MGWAALLVAFAFAAASLVQVRSGEATVIITDHPGRSGYGTIKNAPTIKKSDEIDHKGQ